MSTLEKLATDVLEPSPDNPRAGVGDICALADTIASVGVLEPLIVSKSKANGYVVIAGHRRLAAAKKVGVAFVPCVVHEDLDDRTRAEMMLVENLQREDLSVLEEARAYARLVELGHSQRQLATVVGRTQSHISKRVSLLKLPAQAIEALDAGKVTVETALKLTKLPAKTAATIAAKSRVDEWEVDNAIRKHDVAQKTAAARKQLEKAGVTVIETNGKIRYAYLDRIGVDEAAHASEPCHAAIIDYQARPVFVCTDSDRHEPDGASDVKAVDDVEDDVESAPVGETPEQRAAREKREAERQAARDAEQRRKALVDQRVTFAAGVVESVDAREAVELMALGLVAGTYFEDSCSDATVLRLIGFADESLSWDERAAKARGYVAESVANRARFVAAVAISALESIADQPGWSGDDDADRVTCRAYLSFLEARGYELTDVDREAIGEPVEIDPAMASDHEYRITPIGKATPPKKMKLVCACGFEATQTTRELAEERHRIHLEETVARSRASDGSGADIGGGMHAKRGES